jgi:hypothetical protein
LFKLSFILPEEESLEIKITRGNIILTKSIPNPAALKIRTATVIGYDPPKKKVNGVLTVKLDIDGVASRIRLLGVSGALPTPVSSVVPGGSPREVIVRLVKPDPTVVITIMDHRTGGLASIAVKRKPPVEAVKPQPNGETEPR